MLVTQASSPPSLSGFLRVLSDLLLCGSSLSVAGLATPSSKLTRLVVIGRCGLTGVLFGAGPAGGVSNPWNGESSGVP